LVPLPTETLILPDVPDCADPVVRATEPELPLEEDPERIARLPLTPSDPLFAVCILNEPLLVIEAPDVREMEPPVKSPLPPDETTIRPPDPLEPDPTVTLILPPAPDCADPVCITNEPLLPLEALPDCNITLPLTPFAPASDV
jgi:hypothetical protein